jgi:hypothetical protein
MLSDAARRAVSLTKLSAAVINTERSWALGTTEELVVRPSQACTRDIAAARAGAVAEAMPLLDSVVKLVSISATSIATPSKY